MDGDKTEKTKDVSPQQELLVSDGDNNAPDGDETEKVVSPVVKSGDEAVPSVTDSSAQQELDDDKTEKTKDVSPQQELLVSDGEKTEEIEVVSPVDKSGNEAVPAVYKDSSAQQELVLDRDNNTLNVEKTEEMEVVSPVVKSGNEAVPAVYEDSSAQQEVVLDHDNNAPDVDKTEEMEVVSPVPATETENIKLVGNDVEMKDVSSAEHMEVEPSAVGTVDTENVDADSAEGTDSKRDNFVPKSDLDEKSNVLCENTEMVVPESDIECDVRKTDSDIRNIVTNINTKLESEDSTIGYSDSHANSDANSNANSDADQKKIQHLETVKTKYNEVFGELEEKKVETVEEEKVETVEEEKPTFQIGDHVLVVGKNRKQPAVLGDPVDADYTEVSFYTKTKDKGWHMLSVTHVVKFSEIERKIRPPNIQKISRTRALLEFPDLVDLSFTESSDTSFDI